MRPGCDFPIQNLPFGAFRPSPGAPPQIGVAIGDRILDVAAAASSLDGPAGDAARACAAPRLNHLMTLGPQAWAALRLALSRGLSTEHANADFRQHLVPIAQAEIGLPVDDRRFHRFLRFDLPRHQCGTDVSAGQSADAELQIRARSPITAAPRRSVPSGTAFKRPRGQRKAPERCRAELRAVAQSRFRTGARLLHRHAERARRAGPGRQGRGAHLRLLPA